MKKEKNASFEEAMEDLEGIIAGLEKGDLSLEDSVANFKKGMEISNYCSELLDNAEKSITILLKDSNGDVKEEEM